MGKRNANKTCDKCCDDKNLCNVFGCDSLGMYVNKNIIKIVQYHFAKDTFFLIFSSSFYMYVRRHYMNQRLSLTDNYYCNPKHGIVYCEMFLCLLWFTFALFLLMISVIPDYPSKSNRGPICYNCQFMSTDTACNTIETCRKDEVHKEFNVLKIQYYFIQTCLKGTPNYPIPVSKPGTF